MDVAKQDLQSFLEVAEDLNIRGLSERNLDSWSSREKIHPQFPKQDVEPSSKGNRNKINNRRSLILENGKQFVWLSCDKQFLTQTGLSLHKQSFHMGVQFSCDKCDFKGTQKSHLKQHVASIHEGERHPCKHCDYKATTRSNLHRHLLKYHD